MEAINNKNISNKYVTSEYITFIENYTIYKGVKIIEKIHQQFTQHEDYNNPLFIEYILFDESISTKRWYENQSFINAYNYYSLFVKADIPTTYQQFNNLVNKINDRYLTNYYTESSTTTDYIDLEPFNTYISLINATDESISTLEKDIIKDINETYINM